MSTASFLWYDLETWGTDPRGSRIAQFAAQRTDTNLLDLGEPELIWVAPALDFVPAPEAAFVTGLDPFEVERRGECEAHAFARIHAAMSAPGTCATGWNTLRFDDEFIRFGLYRNFYDPYGREWSNGNSRWDLLDFARLCHALRPEGIVWPRREDGAPSFRLEHLAAANGVSHEAAHDALSDVQATLGVARLMRAAQPKLWDYHLGLRDKRRVEALLWQSPLSPLLHISQRFPATRACAGIVLPICVHPRVRNQVVVLELHDDPSHWLRCSATEIAARVFVSSAALAEGEARIPLKAVHLNRSPALVELRHVREAELQRMGVDADRCLRHAAQLNAVPDLAERIAEAFNRPWSQTEPTDVDGALYDALPDRADEPLKRQIRNASPNALAAFHGRFRDPRGDELLWRYRARNWPETLSAAEQAQWREEVRARLNRPAVSGAQSEIVDAEQRLRTLREEPSNEPARIQLAESLQRWYQRLRESTAID